MSTDTILAFAGLAAVLVAIPGPAVILVLKSAVLRGRRSAIVTALGVLLADVTWATASVVGLTALLVSSQLAFDTIRMAGAAYLVYLGMRLLRAPGFQLHAAEHPSSGDRVSLRRAFSEGFLSDLSNPKTVLVYASVIPQFLSVSDSGTGAFILGLTFAILGFAALTVYALVFGAARSLLSHGRLMQRVLRGCGGILVCFGAGLLVERPSH